MKPNEVKQVMEFPEVFLSGVMVFVYSFSAATVAILLYMGVV